jgi:membrane protease YdiL (CAAX protease family)
VCDRGAIELARAPGQPRSAHATPRPSGATSAKPAVATKAAAVKKAVTPAAKKAAAPAPKKPQSASPAPRPKLAWSGGVEWTLPEAGLLLLIAFALLVGEQALPGKLASAPVWAGVTLLVYDAALALALWFLARRRTAPLLSAFRFDVPPGFMDAIYAVGVALGCWLFSVMYRALALGMGLTPPVSEGVDLTRVFGSGIVGIVATVAVVALAGPLIEEVLLRGVVLSAVARTTGAWPAIILCAAAFALLHASLWSLLPLTVLGIGLGWLAVRSRSLWPAVAAHVLYNLVFVAAAFYAAR